MKHTLGLALGRFQPLHNDHLSYLLAAADRAEHLLVGITEPEPSLRYTAKSGQRHRNRALDNPFTFHERLLMIRSSLLGAGLPLAAFTVIPTPWPGERIRLWLAEACLPVVFVTVLDEWGSERIDMLRAARFVVEILPNPIGVPIRGIDIRSSLRAGTDVSMVVPPEVNEWLSIFRFPERELDGVIKMVRTNN